MTALGATAGQNLATILGGHAGTETVLVDALAIPRLESPLHTVIPSY